MKSSSLWSLFSASLLLAVTVPLICLASGCHRVKPVQGGTEGTLQVGGQGIAEIQLVVHQHDGISFEPVGFAVTDDNGNFRLMENQADGPLWLPPGEYRVTLESIGPPIRFTMAYSDPRKTPVQIRHSKQNAALVINVPAEAVRK